MNIANIRQAENGFKVLQTSKKSQTAIMTLLPGQDSGPMKNEHPKSEQTLLVIKGQISARIGKKRRVLKSGDAVIVPAGADHKFTNTGKTKAITFNVYAPPAYSPDKAE